MDYLGINIEGPSAEGFFFYPVYRVHGNPAGAQADLTQKVCYSYGEKMVE